jgi:formylmethanofuran dehydrogenase subunit E-like metal-binding protein
VGAGVKTRASLTAMWADGADVTMLSAVETLDAVVAGVGAGYVPRA